MALEAHKRFGIGVVVQIAQVVSSDYKGSKLHPCLEPGFHNSAAQELLYDEDGQLVPCTALEQARAQYCNEHYLTC